MRCDHVADVDASAAPLVKCFGRPLRTRCAKVDGLELVEFDGGDDDGEEEGHRQILDDEDDDASRTHIVFGCVRALYAVLFGCEGLVVEVAATEA